MRLLLTGDIHIGRTSMPAADSMRSDATRASAAWDRIVALAIAERADVVCLSGDVTDKENKFWEALGPLESGVARLADAGVITVAVSGNHDYAVLQRLADQLPKDHFRLLGRGGTWERVTIERTGTRLHIDGWSFPREKVARSPAADYDLKEDATTPVLGLLHGDLGVPGSNYAPLDAAHLQSLPPHAWLLGHIHKPRLLEKPPWILYPGSPQALDFGEQGAHGVWIADVDHGIDLPELRPMSTVRYEQIDIDVSAAKSVGDVEARILKALRHRGESLIAESGSHLECLMLRLVVSGRTPLSDRMAEITSGLQTDLSRPVAGARLEVERLTVATLPDIDVHAYAKAPSAPGAVARLLVDLERGAMTGDIADLVSRTRRELEANDDHRYFVALDRREITDEIARAHLRAEARALLTQLVAQTP